MLHIAIYESGVRGGETGGQISKLGEIVVVDAAGWVVAVTEEGDHIRCPVSKLHRAPAKRLAARPRKRPIQPDYIAAEELIRDFHSAEKPVTVRWLDRTTAMAACQAATND
jgi:hypothetical protein